jgi:hypothetical protein
MATSVGSVLIDDEDEEYPRVTIMGTPMATKADLIIVRREVDSLRELVLSLAEKLAEQ